jgi:hypothetical protein
MMDVGRSERDGDRSQLAFEAVALDFLTIGVPPT